MLELAEAQTSKRRASVQKANATRIRNNLLRRSSLGKLLLVLRRCELFNEKPNPRATARLVDELRYACTLADASGVRRGWIVEGLQRWAIAFELSSGDVVFGTGEVCLAELEFPRLPDRDNPRVLAEAIEQLTTARCSERKISTVPSTKMAVPRLW